MKTLSKRAFMRGAALIGTATAFNIPAMAEPLGDDAALFKAVQEIDKIDCELIEISDQKSAIEEKAPRDFIVVKKACYTDDDVTCNEVSFINGFCDSLKDKGVKDIDAVKRRMLSDLEGVKTKRNAYLEKQGHFKLAERQEHLINRLDELYLFVESYTAKTPKGLAARIKVVLNPYPDSAYAHIMENAARLV